MNHFRSLKSKLYDGLVWSFKESEPYFFTYSVAVLIGVLGFYFLNKNIIAVDTYEDFPLRFLSGLLVTPLLFYKYWPDNLTHFKVWYWYVALIYTLPFFFTFMLLMNPTSEVWHINGLICFVVLALFVDWVSFLLLLVIGIVLGIIFFVFMRPVEGPLIPLELLSLLFYSYLGPIIYIILFSRKKEKVQQEKLLTMKMLAGSIAHELRTPLSSLSMDAKFLGKIFPYYQDAYNQAKDAQLPIHKLSDNEENGIMAIPKNMQMVSKNAHTIITMLLTNLNEEATIQSTEIFSIRECVTEALQCYPFSSCEHTLLHWEEKGPDFSFVGHKELMKHVLFNLLKNALYAIASAGKGEIFITIEPAKNRKDRNKLIFKDTGPGIPSQYLRHIFDRFYSKKEHGAGIGLAFCQSVIRGFGGEITCTSLEGNYTTFMITLPTMVENTINQES